MPAQEALGRPKPALRRDDSDSYPSWTDLLDGIGVTISRLEATIPVAERDI